MKKNNKQPKQVKQESKQEKNPAFTEDKVSVFTETELTNSKYESKGKSFNDMTHEERIKVIHDLGSFRQGVYIQSNPNRLKDLSPKKQTDFICELAIKKDPFSIKHVHNQSLDLCLLALSINPESLQFIKSENQSKALLVDIYKNYPDKLPSTIRFYKGDDSIDELLNFLINKNPLNFQFFPEHLKTEALCEKAIELNPELLRFIKHQNEKMCRRAVYLNPSSFEFVQNQFKTKEMCEFVVKNNGLMLEFVPHTFKDIQMCRVAISQNKKARQFSNYDLI